MVLITLWQFYLSHAFINNIDVGVYNLNHQPKPFQFWTILQICYDDSKLDTFTLVGLFDKHTLLKSKKRLRGKMIHSIDSAKKNMIANSLGLL